MIDYKQIKGKTYIHMADLLRSDIEDAMEYQIKEAIREFFEQNLEQLVDEGYLTYMAHREEDTQVGEVSLNLITNKELNRLLELEQEVERYQEMMQRRKKEFLRMTDDSKRCYRCGKEIKGTINTIIAELAFSGETQKIRGKFCDDCVDKVKDELRG